MTFWQDARPIPGRPRGRRGQRLRTRRRALVLVGALVGALLVGVAYLGPGRAALAPDPAVGAGRRVDRGVDRGASAPPEWRTVPARWTRTLADAPQEVLVDPAGAVAIGSRTVTALALDTGSEEWHVALDRPNPEGAADATVVVLSTAAGFVGLDRASGRPRWSAPTAETPGAVALATPEGEDAVAVVATTEAGLVGLDAATGEVRWSLRLPGPVRGRPVASGPDGVVAVVTAGVDARLRVLDLRSGASRWDRPVGPQTSTPAIANGAVVLGSGDGRFHSAVESFALADGAPRWSTRVPASFQPGLAPAVVGGAVFVLDQLDHLTKVDEASGARRWSRDLHGAALIGTPLVVGEAVLVADATRSVLTVDRRTGRLLTRRAATGVPVRVAAAAGLVVVAQRLVERDQIGAYPAPLVGSVRGRSSAGPPRRSPARSARSHE